MATRREVLKALGVLGAAGASAALSPLKAFGASNDSSGVASFTRPLRIPPVLSPTSTTSTADYYDMQVMQTTAEIIPGKSTPIIGYNGMTPGPTIKARVGRQTVVNFYNGLPATTLGGASGKIVTHLHGGHTPSADDGFPTDFINPGSNRSYTYPNNQLPATMWYHDHTDMFTGPHVWYGMAGFYLLTDSVEEGLNLPSGAYEVPLVIQDRNFNSAGALVYTANMNGETGNAVLVNGVVQPYFNVAVRKYRFRILNGSNSRFYRLALSNGGSFKVLGMEGGLLPKPVTVTSITLAPAERADIVIDFSGMMGMNVTLRNTLVSSTSTVYNLMRFNCTSMATDTSVVPSSLRTFTKLNPANAVRTRNFTLSMMGGMMGSGMWTINGAPFDENVSIANPKVNTTEIWRFTNQSMMDHPIHLHQTMFQILDINGVAPPATHAGWKDIVVVPRMMGTARIIAKFSDYTGRYVLHCHNLEHEDMAMMARYDVVP
jgi:spore coat protein A